MIKSPLRDTQIEYRRFRKYTRLVARARKLYHGKDIHQLCIAVNRNVPVEHDNFKDVALSIGRHFRRVFYDPAHRIVILPMIRVILCQPSTLRGTAEIELHVLGMVARVRQREARADVHVTAIS